MLSFVTPWREWQDRQRARVRNSPRLTASFLIAVFVFVKCQAALASRLWTLFKAEDDPASPKTIETLTWPWLREHLIDFGEQVRPYLSAQSSITLLSIANCFLAAKWLYALSWKETCVKLGMPRPRWIELVVPAIASVAGLAIFVGLSFPRISLLMESPDAVDLQSFIDLVARPLGVIVPIGFLYRGLTQDAKWSWQASLAALVILTAARIMLGHLGLPAPLHDLQFAAEISLYLAIVSSVCVAIYALWQKRLWSLIFVALTTGLMTALTPMRLIVESPFVVRSVLFHGGQLLLLAWSLAKLRSDSRPAQSAA